MSAWKNQMWFSYSSSISAIIESALRGRQLSCSFSKALEQARQLVIEGAWFLLSGDALEGQIAMNRIDSLTEENLADIADLCGMLATLIAAGVRRVWDQGGLTGRTLITRYEVKRADLKKVWLIACPTCRVYTLETRKAA